jgi:hypothetical protein
LGELDLARVEEGRDGMRLRTEDEARLVAASRVQVERRRRQRRLLQLTAVAAVAVILGAALLFLWQRQQARASEERARDRAYAALGNNLAADHPTEASLVALEIRQPDSTPTADALLHKALADSMKIATLTGHMAPVVAASFSPDGTRVVTASVDQTARIWNVGTEYLQGVIRSRIPLCLPVPFRRNTLGEDPREAERQEKACRACRPKFFARVQGVPVGNPQPYITAWRAYRGCLEDSR